MNRGMRVLQTLALPLGYVAMLYSMLPGTQYSISFQKKPHGIKFSMQRTVCGRASRSPDTVVYKRSIAAPCSQMEATLRVFLPI